MDTPEIFPLQVGAILLTGWDGHSYVGDDGRTFWSLAGSPSAEDAAESIANPPQVIATPADIAAERWRVENGGVVVSVSTGAHRFDTTRENRSMWLALQLQAQANPALAQGWKTLDHGFVVLTAADILAVCAAVYAHVEACFAREAQLIANPPALADLTAAFSDLA